MNQSEIFIEISSIISRAKSFVVIDASRRMSGEILVEIPDEKLHILATLYREKAQWAPYMISFVETVIKWKKSEKFKNSVKLYSPNSCWEQDGTIIATLDVAARLIVVFTFADDCTNLYKGLSQTKRILFQNERNNIYGVHQKMVPTVKKFIEEKHFEVSEDIYCYIYTIPPEEAKKFTTDCPPDFYVKKLDLTCVNEINSIWPHKFPNSKKYFGSFIEMNGGYGIFLKSTNQLVAWILKHCWGHLAMLQTKEEFKGRGLGSLATKILSKEIAEDNHWPTGTVLLDNLTSIRMFEKLGFTRIGICNFTIFSNKI